MGRLGGYVLVVAATTFAVGCGDGGAEPGVGDATVGSDGTLQLDATSDPTGGDDVIAPGGVAIVSFHADYERITHGPDVRGQHVAGEVTFTWTTQNAVAVRLEADGVPVALDACVPTGAGPCHEAGRVTLAPSEARTFTFGAVGPGGSCGDSACPERTAQVALVPPAIIAIEPERLVVPAGEDLRVPYTADAPSWAIGRVRDGAAGLELEPCVPAQDASEADPCVLEAAGDEALEVAGTAVFRAVDRAFSVAVVAENGAEDGLGDIGIHTLATPITVPIEVRALSVTPPRVLPGGSVQVAWRVVGAQSIELAASHPALTGLSTCVGLGDDGAGFCTLEVGAGAALGEIPLTLTARQAGGLRSVSTVALEIIGGPRVDAFEVAPAAAVPGQEITLSWTAYGAEDVAVTADAIDGLEACGVIGADGAGSCVATVSAGATPGGAITLTLEATHGAVGPGATAQAALSIGARPAIVDFWADPETVEAGAVVSLQWETAASERVILTEGSGAISPSELEACARVDAVGAGSCTFTVPGGLSPGDLTMSLVAVGPTGARSTPTAVVVGVGERPEVTFGASPLVVPEGGGDVTLSWSAVGATAVRITDGDEGVVVETAAASGEITVSMMRPNTWTIRATNAFGMTVGTASATIEGAPVLTAVAVDGADVLDGAAVVVPATSAALAWEVTSLDATDRVTLERAPLPAAHDSCDTVSAAAWAIAGGFTATGAAAGTEVVTGLTSTAECFRLTAEDLDASPSQRDMVVFKILKAPAIDGFDADDDTVEPGDAVTLTWETRHAYAVELAVAPVGAVTSQQLAGCAAVAAAGDGACEVTIQPGTPLGDATFTLVATGEEAERSAPATAAVTLGEGARVLGFAASPTSASGPVDAGLSWSTTRGASLTIRDDEGEILATTSAAEIAAGSHVVAGVTRTTTWTLTVENAFGVETRSVTTFIGPSIQALSVNGQDALGGEVAVVTGPVTVSWTTESADGEHLLATGAVPAGGDCGAAGFTVAYEDDDPAPAANHGLGVVTTNRCVRLRVSNEEAPPQTSVATFLLREVPEVVAHGASPGSIGAGGGTVIIGMQVRGATQLALTAQYLAGDGSSLGTRAVCNQGSLNAGALTGGASADAVQCAHNIAPCNFLCLNNGMPAGTARVRYAVQVSDPEGDGASSTTAGGGDVTID